MNTNFSVDKEAANFHACRAESSVKNIDKHNAFIKKNNTINVLMSISNSASSLNKTSCERPEKQNKRYDEQIKKSVIQKVIKENYSPSMIAKDYGLSRGKIYYWLKKNPEWRGVPPNADDLAKLLAQKVAEVNRNLLTTQKRESAIPGDTRQNVRAGINDTVNTGVPRPRSATGGEEDEGANGTRPVQPHWRPW